MSAVEANAFAAPEHLAWHALPPTSALARLESDEERGLSEDDVRERRRLYGANVLEQRRGATALQLLWHQIHNPIVYLLLASSTLAFVLGKVIDAAVVFGAVVVNALIGFFQEYRAGKAIEALSRMVPQDAQVIRDGRLQTIPAPDLVPGDVVLLASGDRVPADLRLLAARNLQIEEAALTGESVPSAKALGEVPEQTPIADRMDMAFGGTLVRSGTARAVVVATGTSTELGRISHLLEEATEVQTPLTRAIASVGKLLTVVVLAISTLLLVGSLVRGYSVADAALVAITLAVASIPEGLPAIITIALAIGVQRMAARRAVVRKLPSVETLGSTTVICSDKTGTLTRNEMTVVALATPHDTYGLSGVGLRPVGELSSSTGVRPTAPDDVRALVAAAALCNDASLRGDGETWTLSGDPTEGALVVAAMKLGVDADSLRRDWRRLDSIPFESEHQFMATLHATPDGHVVYMKGAPEVVLRRCTLSPHEQDLVMARVAAFAAEGMRVLAVAQKRMAPTATLLNADDVEAGLEWVGLEGMIDPPRPEAIEAVATCHTAGIVVKMITGDHLGTAEAIGRQLGLLRPGEHGMSGAELAQMSGDQLRKAAVSTNVFARVAPEHKLQLVRALQEAGQVVAMTGDGVNDAPALKQADVGIAMGITGTAVSKEAADVVLADDNFATIASAVEEGRRIYDNLIKSLAFVLPTNLGLGLILIAAVPFFPLVPVEGELVPLMPAKPSQLLWINLVTSVALTLPLAFEIIEPDAMRRPPRTPGSRVLDRFVIMRTLLVAILMAGGGLGMFLWEYWTEVGHQGHAVALREAQTEAVTTVVLFQVFYLFNCRSLRASVFRIGFFSNPVVFIGIALLILLQAAFIYVPFMQRIFDTAPLQLEAIAFAALVAAVVFPIITLEKLVRQRSDSAHRAAPGRPSYAA